MSRKSHPRSPPAVGPEMLESLFYGLNAGIYVVGMDGRISMVNPRAEELLGRSAHELLGADSHDLLHRKADGSVLPRSACLLLKALTSGAATSGEETWLERGDGTLLPVGRLTAPYQTAGERTGAVVFFTDLTYRDAAEHRRQTQLATLENLTDRLTMVTAVSTVLTSTLDVEEGLQRLVRLVVPRLGDWAVVDLIGEANEVRRLAVVHYQDGSYLNIEHLEGPMPPVSETSWTPLSKVLRGGPAKLMGPEDYTVIPDSGIALAQREMFRATGMHSAGIAPLRGRREVLGALTIGRGDQPEPFSTADLALTDDIARRAGLAVENALLYERQRRVSETMQRHLLPPLPKVEGLEMAVRYLPSPHGSHVGGDWYDAFVLPDGNPAMVVGDVVGHDLQAAASMSQVRNMLRAFAWERGEPPSLIVERLDQALPYISDVPMATLILAQMKQEERSWRLRWTNAGHPPPLLVTHEGRTHYLTEGHGILLGTGLPQARVDATALLPPLTTVVLYTDGLVEAPDLPLEQGLPQLSRHAAALAHRPLDEFCNLLIERVQPAGGDDDIALLALRVPPSAG